MAKKSANSVKSLSNLFFEYLKDKGLRSTRERSFIVEKIDICKGSFTIADLQEIISAENSNAISRATVYNTIKLLLDAGLLKKCAISDGIVRYEHSNQIVLTHLFCTECGKIKDVKDNSMMAYMNAKRFSAFTSVSYSLTVYGICNSCARRAKKRLVRKK